jgi:hypothetical protein
MNLERLMGTNLTAIFTLLRRCPEKFAHTLSRFLQSLQRNSWRGSSGGLSGWNRLSLGAPVFSKVARFSAAFA